MNIRMSSINDSKAGIQIPYAAYDKDPLEAPPILRRLLPTDGHPFDLQPLRASYLERGEHV